MKILLTLSIILLTPYVCFCQELNRQSEIIIGVGKGTHVSVRSVPDSISQQLPIRGFPEELKMVFQNAKTLYYNNNYNLAYDLHLKFLELVDNYKFEEDISLYLITSYSQIAAISTIKSDFVISIHFYQLALKLLMSHHYPINDLAFYLFNLGKSYFALSDYSNSIIYYLEAEQIISKLILVNNYSELASIKNNIGLCYLKLGKYKEALNYFNATINIYNRIKDFPNQKKEALNNIALTYQDLKDFDNCLAYFNKSLENFQTVADTVNIALALNNIGNVHLNQGQFSASISYYDRAYKLLLSQQVINPLMLLPYSNNLSLAYLKLGKLDSAIVYNSKSKCLLANIPASSFKNYLSDYYYTFTDYVDINLNEYKKSGNIDYLIDSYKIFIQSICIFVENCGSNYYQGISNSFFVLHKNFFDLSLESAALFDKLSPKEIPRTAIIVEIFKTLSLLNFSNELSLLRTDSEIMKSCELISGNYNHLNTYFHDVKDLNDLAVLSYDSLLIVSDNYNNLKNLDEDYLKDRILHYINNVENNFTSKLKQKVNTTYVDYFFTPKFLYIHIYDNNQIKLLSKPVTKEIVTAIHKFIPAIKSINNELIDSISNYISKYLIETILPFIHTKEITVIPDNLTNRIPFDLLISKDSTGPFLLLIKQYSICFALTFLNRNYFEKKEVNDYSLTFCGFVPEFSRFQVLESLNDSEKEVKEIDSIFLSFNKTSKYFTGNQASLINIFYQGINSRILHLATHSIINDTIISLNRLALTDDSQSLFLPVLFKIPFNNDLLVLSSCETLIDFSFSEDGNISFLRSFSHTNTKSIIGSLWKIYDFSSRIFNNIFYNLVVTGESYSSALTKTKRFFINNKEFSHPIFWAPFQLYENK